MVGADVVSDPVGALLQYGPLGLFLALILTGVLVTKAQYLALKEERDNWRKAFETEQAAHQGSRDALIEANGRAEAAVEAAKVTAGLLRDLGHGANLRSAS